MSSLMQEMGEKALALGVPLTVQLDLTYRCNERCVHCYLDHDDHGEMTASEYKKLLDELAQAGVLFLTLSGGEIMLRKDFFEILEYARALMFSVKLKTNGVLIRKREAARLRELAVESVQISVYSHRAEVHDAITLLPGSLARSIEAARFLKSQGLQVTLADVLMRQNHQDYSGVKALAAEIGVRFMLDPTITPMMDGDRSILSLNVNQDVLQKAFRDEGLVGNVEEFCSTPNGASADDMESFPCSAGHTFCYVSPYGDVYPCVQFPLPSGNVRRSRFLDIWNHSPQLNEVREIHLGDLPSCSQCVHGTTCTRCPGLAFLEGNMRGPSTQDCEKSFVRTGIPSKNLEAKRAAAADGRPRTVSAGLIQIQGVSPTPPAASARPA
jgi:radical SAM protein with 4Fe4S-binding SPASM domain